LLDFRDLVDRLYLLASLKVDGFGENIESVGDNGKDETTGEVKGFTTAEAG
jgi:hypothetical protein